MVYSVLAAQIFFAIDPEALIKRDIRCVDNCRSRKALCQSRIDQLLVSHF